jgi:cell wall-associated NlpC family hydrolase
MMKTRITRNVLTIVIAIALVIPTLLFAVPRIDAATTVGQAAAARAQALVGYPYAADGATLAGFGHTGVAVYVYGAFGTTFPNSAPDMLWSGYWISRVQLSQGDLVFFSSPYTNEPDIVGVYIGSGNFVTSTLSRNGVAVRSLYEPYYAAYYYGARRPYAANNAVKAAVTSTPVSNASTFAASGTSTTISAKRSTVVATAKQYLGVPYVFGANGPSSFDCSGFTKYVLGKNGISVLRSAASQWTQGKAVAKADLRPGDLVFFKDTYKPGISHVGIYIGEGNIIDAWPKTGVRTAPLSGSYLTQHYAGARNMFGD